MRRATLYFGLVLIGPHWVVRGEYQFSMGLGATVCRASSTWRLAGLPGQIGSGSRAG